MHSYSLGQGVLRSQAKRWILVASALVFAAGCIALSIHSFREPQFKPEWLDAEHTRLRYCPIREASGAVQMETDSRPIVTNVWGGSPTTKFEMVGALVTKSRRQVFCSATRLSKRVILTAAHCVMHKSVHDILYAEGPDVTSAALADFFEIVDGDCDAEYSGNTSHDLAVLVLGQDVSPPYAVLPVRPASIGEALDFVGYGRRPDHAPNEPELGLRAVVHMKVHGVDVPGRSFSYGDKGPQGRDTCFGDSGGPAFRSDTNEVTGVTTDGNADCSGLGRATQVFPALSWIRERLKEREGFR